MFVRRHASGVVFLACLLATEGLWAQSLPSAATMEVPAGQTLHIRLRQTISSYGSKVDTPISAVLIQPVELDGHIVLPLNTELRGMIARVRRIGIGLSHETALIDLRFDTPPIGYTDNLKEFNRLHTGRAIGAKATLDSWKYFSNEFGYAYNKAALYDPECVFHPGCGHYDDLRRRPGSSVQL